MKNLFFLFLMVFCNFRLALSQIYFTRDTSISVQENNAFLHHAWAGGANAAQPSIVDLNLDGILDLILFDKTGNKITPFLNSNNKYVFAPEYRSAFPNLHDWAIMEDYNCDGKYDIFAYSSGGIEVYKNTSTSTLQFTLVTSLLLTDYGANNFNLFVSSVDLPAITDVDYDGDLDILTFSIIGGFVELHKNMAIENFSNCDTLAFAYTNACWGNFFEGLNSYLINCTFCNADSCFPALLPNTLSKQQKHSGSTLLAIDMDSDNDKDIILGDVSYTNLNLLINGGNNQNANMVSLDTVFPANNNNTIASNIHLFPAAFYLDVTQDGVKDLVVTTNSQNNSENFESIWLYANSGTNNQPDFNFVSNSFLQNEMLDFGEGSYPTFFDYNNDGLLDIVIGNYGYHDVGGNDISSLCLLENIGTPNQPKYSLISRDFESISTLNLNIALNIPAKNLYPTFGDLDGDNDKDMILGDADGNLHLFNNDGTTPSHFNLTTVNFEHIDVGYFATPQLVDVNRDGLLDLLVGDMMGTITYFPNKGNVNIPMFDSAITNFGGIDVDANYISTGYSTPFLVDINGDYHLFVGSNYGGIYHYDNIDGNLNGNFNLINNNEQNIKEGSRTALCIADLTSDNIFDMILGNYAGGLSFFLGDTISTVVEQFPSKDILIYPNPTKDLLFVESYLQGNIEVVSILGETIYSANKTNTNHKIDMSRWAKGIYLLKLNHFVQKIVKE